MNANIKTANRIPRISRPQCCSLCACALFPAPLPTNPSDLKE